MHDLRTAGLGWGRVIQRAPAPIFEKAQTDQPGRLDDKRTQWRMM